MKMTTAVDLDMTFEALRHGTRRAILDRLARGELALAELAAPFPMSQTGVSKHVRVLTDAGLVRVEKRGRTRYCRLNAKSLEAASDWLAAYEPFWNQQIENLSQHFEAEDQ